VTEEKRFLALEFAVRAHRGQFRKGTRIPYVVHPIAVGRRLMELGFSEPLILAGFLHDTLEDTGVSKGDLEELFGRHVADIVEAVSECDKTLPWEQRKQTMLENLEHAETDVLTLALADKLDNLMSIQRALIQDEEDVWSRFNRPRAQQAWYFGRLADIFNRRIGSGSAKSLVGAFNAALAHVFGQNP
jgi:(p)ppGpp synthase/HD superfamily hydrolase